MRRGSPALRVLLATFLAGAVPSFASDEYRRQFQLVVHAENQVEPLDPHLVSKLFLRKVRRWPDGTAVQPFDALRNSPLHAAFSEAIHGRSASSIDRYWQRMIFTGRDAPPEAVASDRQMLERVRSHRGGIGYVSPEALLGSGVRLLEVVDGGLAGFGSTPRSPSEPPEPRHLLPPRSAGSLGSTAALRSSAVAVDPGRPSVLYASFPGIGLASSQDGGDTWEHLGTSPEGHGSESSGSGDSILDQILALTDGSALLATGGKRVWRSTDGGRRWREVAPGPARSLIADPVEPGIVYAFAPGSLWRSLDRGRSFSLLSLPGSQELEALVAVPSWPGLLAACGATIWQGEPRGERWQIVSRIPSVGGIRDLAVDPRSSDVLYAATSHGAHRSGDRGQSWEPLGLDGEVDSLVATSSRLIASQGGKAFVLRDGSWRRVPELDGARIGVDPANPDRLYAAGPDGRALSSDDGGDSWRRLGDLRRRPVAALVRQNDRRRPPTPRRAPAPAELQLNCGSTSDHVAALAVAPSEPSTVYAGGRRGVHVSRDHGVAWAYNSTGLEVTDVHALAVDPEKPGLVYAGTHGRGVFRSVDGGASWQPARRGLNEPLVHSLLVDPSTRSRIYAGTASGLFVSSDFGESWSPFGPAAPAEPAGRTAFLDLVVDPRSPECLGAAASGGGPWLAEAPGFRWTRTEGLMSLDPEGVLDGGELCFGWASPAGGRPWDRLGIDLRAPRVRSLLFDPLRAENLFAATVLGIWHSGDGGKEWRRLEVDGNVAALAAMGTSGLLAGGLYGLRRSRDGGDSWRRSELREHVYALAVDPVDSATIYAGLGAGRVAVSWDAGESWQVRKLPPPPERAADRPRWEARPAPATAAGEVSSAALALWHEVWRTPAADLEQRALLLTELLSRTPAAFEGTVRGVLIEILEQLLAHGIDTPRAPLALHLAPGERWMAVSYGTKGCPACADELRVFDLRALPLRPAEENRGQLYWRALHDPSLEPGHLAPRWVLPEAGHVVAWSSDGRFLVTQQRLVRRLTGEEPAAKPTAGGAGDLPSHGSEGADPERPLEHAGARLVVWGVGPETRGAGAVAVGPSGPEVARHRQWDVGFEWARCLSRDTAKAQFRRRSGPAERHPETCEVALSDDGERLAFAGVEDGSATVWIARGEQGRVEVDTVWRLPPPPPEPRVAAAYWRDL
ncbi:MAG: hypothetical protein MI919_34490, partial [Holophagales bacterium]|nr:hypothetical protein [Holophagales bacterium]